MADDYKALFEHARTPMILIDEQGYFIDHNEAYRHLFGYQDGTLMTGFTPKDVSPEYQPGGTPSAELSQQNIYIAFQKGWHQFSWLHVHRDGHEFLSQVQLEVINFKGKNCLKTQVLDVNEEDKIRRMVDEKTRAIKEQNRTLEAMFDNDVLGMFFTDGNRTITKANHRMAEILGCYVSDIVGGTTRQFLLSEEDYLTMGKALRQSFVKGDCYKKEIQMRRQDGRRIWCVFSGATIDHHIPPDLTQGMVWFIDDISERRSLEEKLADQYLLAKDANPLTGLPGNNTIKRHLKKSVKDKTDRCVLYIDVDHFKSYNDRYGFAKGDEILLFLGSLLKEIGKDLGIGDYFAGNVGGDDFIIILDAKECEKVASYIIRLFDREIPTYYKDEDRDRGSIQAVARDGSIKTFPIMSLSIAGVCLDMVRNLNHLEVIDTCSAVKRKAKSQQGSVYLCNRRFTSSDK